MKNVETKKSVESRFASISSPMDLRSSEDSTLADGNCAFNAFALGLCELILVDKLANNKSFYETIQAALNLPEPSAEHFREWLKNNDHTQRQRKLQESLREIAVHYINQNYELYYRTDYQNQLWSAYENKATPGMDDTFIPHSHIQNKFNEDGLSKKELIQWWEQVDTLTGKSAKDIYFDNIKKSARSAADRESWGGSPEINALAICFNINVEYITNNLPKNKPIPMLGIGGGIIKGLTLQEEEVLRDLEIGHKMGDNFMINAFASKEELQQAMSLKPEPCNQTLINYILKCASDNIQVPGNIENVQITEEVKTILLKWGILSNKKEFLNSGGQLERDRILNRIRGISSELQKKVFECFIIPPKFRLQNTGAHWTFLPDGSDQKSKDKNVGNDPLKDAPQKDPLPLSNSGLLKDVPKDLVIGLSSLDKKHQAMIDSVFQEYYQENIYVKEEEDLLKEPIKPWQFGYVDYIQACCCGKIFKKEYLARMSENEGCPFCKSLEISDQLYCMYLKLFPKSTLSSLQYSTLSLRTELTLILFRDAVEKKRYFLLEHLLLITTTKQFINYHNRFGKTLLHYAIEKNDAIAALILIKHGADTNALCRSIYRPLDYVDQYFLHETNLGSENTDPLKKILIFYGALSAHQKYFDSEIYSGNNTLSHQGTRLHHACINVNEALVYALCLEDSLDVNARNSTNHTPLATLAYFGGMAQCGNGISIVNFLTTLSKLNIKIELRLEVLLCLREASYVLSEHAWSYYSITKSQFNLMDEICDFFSENRNSYDSLLNAFSLNQTTKSNGYFFCSKSINWNNTGPSLYSDHFDKVVRNWIHQSKKGIFSGKLIIPCQHENSIAIGVVTLKRENNKLEITICLNELKGDKGSFFIKRLEMWVKNIFDCTPQISKNQNNSEPSIKTRLGIILNAIRFIFNQSENDINTEDCCQKYLLFRTRLPIYLNEKIEDKVLFGKTLKEFNLNPDEIYELLKVTRQDYIIRRLVEKNADIGIHSPFSNVFSIAAGNHNYRFIKTLMELGVMPFTQGKIYSSTNKAPYNFYTMALLLSNFSLLEYGNKESVLHACVFLFNGNTKILFSNQQNRKTNLIKAFISNTWEGPFIKYGKHLIEVINQNNETPIFSAIRAGNLRAAQILIHHGASLLHKNKDGDYAIELFTYDQKDKKRACHVVSSHLPWELKELWQAIRNETQKQISANRNLKTKNIVSLEDIKRLNNKKLTEVKITEFNGFSSGVLIFIPKVKAKIETHDDDGDEEMENEEEYAGSESDESSQNEEDSSEEGTTSENDDEPEEEDEPIEKISSKTSQETLLILLDKQLLYLQKLIQNTTILPQEFTHVLTSLLLALQVLNHIKPEARKKKEDELLQIFNTMARHSYCGLLLQTLLTLGPIQAKWRNNFLSSFASFLRSSTQEKSKNELLMLAFLCNLLETEKENDNIILKAYIDEFILMQLTDKNTTNRCEQLLLKNIDVFIKIAHKMGICCMSDITPLLLKKDEQPAHSIGLSLDVLTASSDDKDIIDKSSSGMSGAGSAIILSSGTKRKEAPDEANDEVAVPSAPKKLKLSH